LIKEIVTEAMTKITVDDAIKEWESKK